MPDATGDRAVFLANRNITGDNPDWSSELWLVDQTTFAEMSVLNEIDVAELGD